MEDIHFLLDYGIFPLGMAVIWLFIQNSKSKARLEVHDERWINSQKELARLEENMTKMESAIDAELKELNLKIENLPDKIIDRINKNR